jgi:hypothetical protein
MLTQLRQLPFQGDDFVKLTTGGAEHRERYASGLFLQRTALIGQ